MNCIINIPQEAYDLIMGKTDTANLDLYSTLIQSVKNGIPLDDMEAEPELESADIQSEYSQGDYDVLKRLIADVRTL